MTKEYTSQDLIDSITELYPGNWNLQSGHLNGALRSELIFVENTDPEMFKEIMEFEMKVCERLKKCRGH